MNWRMETVLNFCVWSQYVHPKLEIPCIYIYIDLMLRCALFFSPSAMCKDSSQTFLLHSSTAFGKPFRERINATPCWCQFHTTPDPLWPKERTKCFSWARYRSASFWSIINKISAFVAIAAAFMEVMDLTCGAKATIQSEWFIASSSSKIYLSPSHHLILEAFF